MKLNARRCLQWDIFSLPDLIQLEFPLFQLQFMSLLGSLFEFWYHLLVGAGDEMLGNLVAFVQLLYMVHSRSFSVC